MNYILLAIPNFLNRGSEPEISIIEGGGATKHTDLLHNRQGPVVVWTYLPAEVNISGRYASERCFDFWN